MPVSVRCRGRPRPRPGDRRSRRCQPQPRGRVVGLIIAASAITEGLPLYQPDDYARLEKLIGIVSVTGPLHELARRGCFLPSVPAAMKVPPGGLRTAGAALRLPKISSVQVKRHAGTRGARRRGDRVCLNGGGWRLATVGSVIGEGSVRSGRAFAIPW